MVTNLQSVSAVYSSVTQKAERILAMPRQFSLIVFAKLTPTENSKLPVKKTIASPGRFVAFFKEGDLLDLALKAVLYELY